MKPIPPKHTIYNKTFHVHRPRSSVPPRDAVKCNSGSPDSYTSYNIYKRNTPPARPRTYPGISSFSFLFFKSLIRGRYIHNVFIYKCMNSLHTRTQELYCMWCLFTRTYYYYIIPIRGRKKKMYARHTKAVSHYGLVISRHGMLLGKGYIVFIDRLFLFVFFVITAWRAPCNVDSAIRISRSP